MTQAKQPEGSTVRELMDEVARLRATIALHEFAFDQLHGPLSIAAFEAKVATLTARNERLEAVLRLVLDHPSNIDAITTARRELENKP